MSIGNEALGAQPVAGRIGAEVRGVRLSGQLSAAIVEQLKRILFRYKVIFLRDQEQLDDAAQEAFGRLLGPLIPHPTIGALNGTDSILEVDSRHGRASSWHTDVTFVEAYPQISILRAVVLPEFGGDTVWANTAAAYQSLPQPLQEFADRLWAVHSNDYDYTGSKQKVSAEALRRHHEVFTSTVYETEHPVVRIHPETGERTLVLGHFLKKFVGLSSSDSKSIFSVLQSYVTALENTVRWRWSVGDVAIWDNRATQHVAVDDYGDQRRVLRRVTIDGDVPFSVDGRRSRSLRQVRSQRTVSAEPNDLSVAAAS